MSNAAENLGSKFTCFKCTCKFYDLGVEVPLCPRCGADQREDPNPDPRTAFLASLRRSPSRKKKKKKAAPAVGPSPTIDSSPKLEADDDLLDDDFEKDGDKKKKATAKKK
ncbi:MAG: hypothetical protein GY898_14780 [Proteobacteria bacterium]|nr:hypothetical protein [Pseudomonadota bacterium]